MRGKGLRDAKGRFTTQYIGCLVLRCERLHSSKAFCKRHAKAFARARIDAAGNPIPFHCQRCGAAYIPRSAQGRFCPACRAKAARAREKLWRQTNRSIVRIRTLAHKRRNRSLIRQRERAQARLRRARLRMADPRAYSELSKRQPDRQKFLQTSSLAYFRRRGRWSEREVDLLQYKDPDAARGW